MKKISGFFGEVSSWTKKHKTIFALIITTLFVVVQIPFLVNHEIWNDEAISWGLSKQINPSNIYEVNSIEPHPLLWQIILAPFSQNGFPAAYIGIFSLILVSIAVFLMVRFAPMHFIVKIIFLLSSGFFYYNPVIARDYSIVPLAITLVCIAYEKRHEKPFLYGLSLAFLSQTHFLMYGFMAALILGYLIETITKKDKKALKKISSILKMSVPIIVSVLTILPIVIGSFNGQSIMDGKANEGIAYDVRESFYYETVGTFFNKYNDILSWTIIVTLVIVFLSILSDNIKIALYSAAGFVFWFCTMYFIYTGYSVLFQKVSLLVLMLFAAIWMIYLERDKKRKNIFRTLFEKIEIIKFLNVKLKASAIVMISIIAAMSIPGTMAVAFTDLNGPFSNAKEVSEYFNNEVEEKSLIIEVDGPAYTLLSAATMEQIEKDYSIYNIIFDSFDIYKHQLRYDDETINVLRGYTKPDDDKVKKTIEKFSEEYEHIYVAVSISNTCSGTYINNEEVLKKYEMKKIFNESTDYIDSHNRAPVVLYKVK